MGHARVCPGTEGVVHGRDSVGQQALLGRQSATVIEGNEVREKRSGSEFRRGKTKDNWPKDENRVVWECYLRSKPLERGYRKRMHQIWKEKGMKEVTEQRLCDQRKQIDEKRWLEKLEIEAIKRKIDTTNSDKETEIQTITEEKYVELFGISSDEEEFLGFEDVTMEENEVEAISREETLQDANKEEEIGLLDEEQKSILAKLREVVGSRRKEALPSLKMCDKRVVVNETNKVNTVAKKHCHH